MKIHVFDAVLKLNILYCIDFRQLCVTGSVYQDKQFFQEVSGSAAELTRSLQKWGTPAWVSIQMLHCTGPLFCIHVYQYK